MRKVVVKLILCFAISSVSIFVILNTFGTKRLRDTILEEKKQQLYEEAELLSEEYVSNYFGANMLFAQMLENLTVIDKTLDARIWVLNSKGVVIADTRRARTLGVIDISQLDPGFLDETFREGVYYNGIFDEPMLAVNVPLRFDYTVRGTISLFAPMSMIDRECVTYMNFVNICNILLMVVTLVIYAVIYFMTVVPIRRIRLAAMEYARGNFDYELNVNTADEYEDLADTVKYMVGEIKEMDDYQKKFIANVSHDFRSPLTSIKGYAEAIKDGTIPPEAMGKYLDVILYETERLTKLTSNLLELNKMESKGPRLDVTVFDINAVIKQTVATFEGICTSKRVLLSLEFSSEETPVEADMGKIQQVLYNLIDNAVKFSREDSTVKITVKEKATKVIVSVKDNGIGIPKDSQKKIWDRFYKGDYSRGKDKKGTGLGLSIVKDAITAHGENINVVSTEGVGTEFTFTLPRAQE